MVLRNGLVATTEGEVAAGGIAPVRGERFEDALTSASQDLLREMIRGFAQGMVDAEAETLCTAGYGAAELDELVGQLPEPGRCMSAPYTFVWIDALTRKMESLSLRAGCNMEEAV